MRAWRDANNQMDQDHSKFKKRHPDINSPTETIREINKSMVMILIGTFPVWFGALLIAVITKLMKYLLK